MRSVRILVTGASGFIGHHVVARLVAQGYDVHALGRRTGDLAGVTYHPVDLSDHPAVAKTLESVAAERLLHLAWVTAHPDYYTSPSNLRWLSDSLYLAERFIATGGQRLVGAGSAAEYEYSDAADLIEGVTPLRPNGLYGACKKALFELTEKLATQSGVQQAWGRIFFCYGPGEDAARPLPTLVRRLLAGERIRFHAGTGVRDYVFVEDVADAFVALLRSEFCGPVNVGSGTGVAVRSFVERVAIACGHPGAVDFGAEPMPSYEPKRVVASTDRGRLMLGLRARWTIDEGISETVSWWRGRMTVSGGA